MAPVTTSPQASPFLALRARKPRPLRVLLVQLPIQELAFRRVRGNELVAPGYLKASAEQWAVETGRARELEVAILPREVVDRLGDRALARAIASHAPDVVGFSLFLWNSARTVALARALKKLLPEVAVLVGGPEVTRDNPWCVADPGVDLGVVGEGERTFSELLGWLFGEGTSLERIAGLAIPARTGLPLLSQQREGGVRYTEARPAIELTHVPSPYLSGAIQVEFDRSIGVETLRGCPFKCSFCYYYKQFAKTNAFPRGWLQDHFRFARDHGVKELFFLDPTLNARPRFSEFLDEVIAANEDRALELHAELVADMVDEKIADKLGRANVKQVEVGLQSANMKVLKTVNRMCDLERFTRGATLLDRRGIVVKTDLIIGLPEDTEESCRASIDWVRERKLDADVQVFHLMVLPGTELREKADDFGYERLLRPPYYATRTRWMDEAAMRRLIEYAGQVFEVEFDPPARALLGAPLDAGGTGYWSRATLDTRVVSDEATARERGREAAEHAANALTVIVKTRDVEGDLGKACAFLEELARANPHATLDVAVAAPGPYSMGALSALKAAAATPEAYLNGYHRFQVPPGTLVSTRISALLDADRPLDDDFLEELEAVVPVTYERTVRDWDELDQVTRDYPGRSIKLRRSGALASVPSEAVVARLLTRLEDDPDSIYFESAEDARAWDREARGEEPEGAAPEALLEASLPLAVARS
jgi:radical SAM superfamily enzyme YgiQ (UPF0313 family)